VRYRVDELAARCDVSVDTVRYYQTKGLLHRPGHEGRAAWYDDSHVERLTQIRDLKDRGFTLAMIARALRGELPHRGSEQPAGGQPAPAGDRGGLGELDAGEEALAVALAGPLPGEDSPDARRYSLQDLAAETGMSPTVLEALAREGILIPRSAADAPYTSADVTAVEAGLALLEAGVPLSELLALARRHDVVMREVAAHAVDLFARFVRDPIRSAEHDTDAASARMVAALQTMLPAASQIVAHHFRRLLLQAARERIEADGGLRPDA